MNVSVFASPFSYYFIIWMCHNQFIYPSTHTLFPVWGYNKFVMNIYIWSFVSYMLLFLLGRHLQEFPLPNISVHLTFKYLSLESQSIGCMHIGIAMILICMMVSYVGYLFHGFFFFFFFTILKYLFELCAPPCVLVVLRIKSTAWK